MTAMLIDRKGFTKCFCIPYPAAPIIRVPAFKRIDWFTTAFKDSINSMPEIIEFIRTDVDHDNDIAYYTEK